MSDSFISFLPATPNSTHNSHEAPNITTISPIAQPCCICTDWSHLFNFNHHLADVAAEQGSSNHVVQQSSSRWSPTPIQLLVLEELYRQGMKTPSAEQIQQIASQLRQFGKIEGKNVFYWFQNHKARERQKRRRREMEENTAAPAPAPAPAPASTQGEKQKCVMGNSQRQAPGLKATGCGVKETKRWASTSNCSGHAEESAAVEIISERHAKCQNMEMPFFLPISVAATASESAHRTRNAQLLTPETCYNSTSTVFNRGSFTYYNEENSDPRTLDLFPLKRDDQDSISMLCTSAPMDTDVTCNQFFEFLPLRN